MFGEYGHFATKMVLDLTEDWTTLLEQRCPLCENEQHTFKPTIYEKLAPEQPISYTHEFCDVTVTVNVEKTTDQTCIAYYCSTEVPFYVQSASYIEQHSYYDGVIGLSKATTTFPYNYRSNDDAHALNLNQSFYLSYSADASEPSFFSLSEPDKRFYDNATPWAYAHAATYPPNENLWAV